MQRALILLFSGLAVMSCTKDKQSEVTTTGAPTGNSHHAGSVDSAKPADNAKPSAIPAVAAQPAVVFKEGPITPESVL